MRENVIVNKIYSHELQLLLYWLYIHVRVYIFIKLLII